MDKKAQVTPMNLVIVPALTMDCSKYIPQELGVALTQCLAELVSKRPCDPIEWIAHWLYRYADSELYYQEKAINIQEQLRESLALSKEKESRLRSVISIKDEKSKLRSLVDEGKKKKSKLCDLTPRPPTDPSKLTAADINNPILIQRLRFLANLNIQSTTVSKASGKDRLSHRDKEFDKRSYYVDEHDNVVRNVLSETGRRKVFTEFPSDTDLDEDGILRQRYDDEDEDDERWGGQSAARSKIGLSDAANIDLGLDTTWCLDCNQGLVCRHPILGDLRARCPLVHPETPQQWKSQGYHVKNLYDHEIYSVPDPVAVRKAFDNSSVSTATTNSTKSERITSTRNLSQKSVLGGGGIKDFISELRKPT